MQQSVDSGSSGTFKKSLFGIQRNMSVPNAAESNVSGLIKKQSAIGRGAPPPVPPNKPIIPPKKDLISFIKKTPVAAENTTPTIDKEQKDSALRHNSFLSNDITATDKQEEMVNN